MKPFHAIAVTLGVLALAAGAWLLAERLYLSKARELRDGIAAADRVRSEAEAMLDERRAWAARRDALGATMIAGAPDEFEHTLRAGLAGVAQAAGLSGVSSGNGRPVAMASPVARRAGRELGSILRAEPDFHVVHAWLAGTGDLGAVLQTVATLEAQPWVHRVEGFTVRPENRERTLFSVRVDLATMRMDSVARTNAGLPEIRPPTERAVATLAAVLEDNPFGTQTIVAETTPEPRPGPRRPPYGNWRVTGLIEGERTEALMVNQESGERRVVLPGGRVLDATFESGSGERAIFIIDGEPHAVRVGETLDQCRPASPEELERSAQVSAREGTP